MLTVGVIAFFSLSLLYLLYLSRWLKAKSNGRSSSHFHQHMVNRHTHTHSIWYGYWRMEIKYQDTHSYCTAAFLNLISSRSLLIWVVNRSWNKYSVAWNYYYRYKPSHVISFTSPAVTLFCLLINDIDSDRCMRTEMDKQLMQSVACGLKTDEKRSDLTVSLDKQVTHCTESILFVVM